MEPTILSVAFIVAVTAFFKEQFALAGKTALGAAFLVSLVVGLLPQISGLFPELAPWIEGVMKVVTLFLSAAGGYDFVMGVRNQKK